MPLKPKSIQFVINIILEKELIMINVNNPIISVLIAVYLSLEINIRRKKWNV